MQLDNLPNIDAENVRIEPEIYRKNGRNVIVEFDKCFENGNPLLNQFIIVKPAYSKNLDSICRYCNTFFKYYDTEKEFLSGLLCLKYQIDNREINYTLKTFISDIAECLFTDNVIKHIFDMVDDYYVIDLTPTDELKEIDLHALQFLNEHGKALLALSIAYKLTIPVVCHYYYVYNEEMARNARIKQLPDPTLKDYLYNIFLSYFPLFQGEAELFNKLVVTINSHLMDTKTSDKTLWNRMRNKAMTPTIYEEKLASSVIVDLIPKAIFEKNLIFLIQCAIPFQIKQSLLAKDKYDYTEISVASKSDDEPSGLEKLDSNNANKINDLDIVLSTVNIKNTIKKIVKDYNVTITQDEIDYYKNNLKGFIFSDIILSFFAKYFGGYYDLRNISKKNYIKLMIIFKHIMEESGFVYINQIMTGNISKSIKRRKISTKQLKKIEELPRFRKVMNQYSMAMDANNNAILRAIATLINTPITYCDYNNQDKLGADIISDIDLIVDEYLRFISMF